MVFEFIHQFEPRDIKIRRLTSAEAKLSEQISALSNRISMLYATLDIAFDTWVVIDNDMDITINMIKPDETLKKQAIHHIINQAGEDKRFNMIAVHTIFEQLQPLIENRRKLLQKYSEVKQELQILTGLKE